jgi:lysozyme family protein
MANINYYQNLWSQMTVKINEQNNSELKMVINKILANKARYQNVCNIVNSKMPYYFVATIHYRECDLNFSQNLSNGDPLTARTVNEPKGRPVKGNPPFTWEECAVDALQLKGVDKITDWSIPNMLKTFEDYNGDGYLKYHPTVNTPYVWSGTNLYTKGKYASDGKFDPNLVDKQIGCAVLLKYFTTNS